MRPCAGLCPQSISLPTKSKSHSQSSPAPHHLPPTRHILSFRQPKSFSQSRRRPLTRMQVRWNIQKRRLRVRRVAFQRYRRRCASRSRPLTLRSTDGGFYSGAFSRGQPAAGHGVFTFANGNKQGGNWIAQVASGLRVLLRFRFVVVCNARCVCVCVI